MAGGPNAAVIPCLFCAGPADRQSEGLETDYYRCRSCGAGFGFDFEEAGPPERPMWPITPEQRSQILGTMGSKKPDRC